MTAVTRKKMTVDRTQKVMSLLSTTLRRSELYIELKIIAGNATLKTVLLEIFENSSVKKLYRFNKKPAIIKRKIGRTLSIENNRFEKNCEELIHFLVKQNK
jgi:hypothetical protein